MELTNAAVRLDVPACGALAVRLDRGQQVRVIDVEGGQVADVFAFAADDAGEYLSASHTRTATSRLFPRVGEDFVTNRRRPILAFIADTSPGVHDMLIAACDPARYQLLGATEHASCADNLRKALHDHRFPADTVPQPVNLFMNIPVSAGELSWLPAMSRAGDAVSFEALMPCLFAVSACPMDLNSINGERPTGLVLEVTEPKSIITKEI